MIKKADLVKSIKEKNPNCNVKHLSLMNKLELHKASDGDLAGAVKMYEARVGEKGLKKEKESIKKKQAVVNEDIKALPTVKKIRNMKADISKELKSGVIKIGKGNVGKGQRLLMNAKKLKEKATRTEINKKEKKIRRYNKIIKTIDNFRMPTRKLTSSHGTDL